MLWTYYEEMEIYRQLKSKFLLGEKTIVNFFQQCMNYTWKWVNQLQFSAIVF